MFVKVIDEPSNVDATPCELLAAMHNRRSKLRAEFIAACVILVFAVTIAVVKPAKKHTSSTHTVTTQSTPYMGLSEAEFIPVMTGWR